MNPFVVEKEKAMLPYNEMIISAADTVIFMIYEIISAVSVITTSIGLVIFVKKHLNALPLARTRILVVSRRFGKIIHSFLSFIFATLGLYIPHCECLLYIFGLLLIVAIQLKSMTILLLIDSIFIDPTGCSRQKGLTPNKITIIMLIATIIYSIAISLFVILSKVGNQHFPIIIAGILVFIQIGIVGLSLFLTKQAKKLRQESVLSSSLTERYVYSKKLDLMNYFFREVTINCIFCSLALITVLITNYGYHLETFTEFALCFTWFEIDSILTSGSLFLSFCSCVQNHRERKKQKITLAQKNLGTIENHFKQLKKEWN